MVTQFREKVKYCRDDNLCFGKPWEEGCGSAEELRESIQAPACVGGDGKVVDMVFLVTTDEESDKCAKLGLEKDHEVVAIAGNFVDEKVPAKLDISLEDQHSNLTFVESSCKEVSAITYWFYGKLVMVIVGLAALLLELVYSYCLANDSYTGACCWTVIGLAIAVHPKHIYFGGWSGCTRYRMLCLYEVASTGLGFYSFIVSQFCQGGSNSSLFKTVTCVKAFFCDLPSLSFDISALSDGTICPWFQLQVTKLEGTSCALIAKVVVCCNASSMHSESGNGVVQSSLVFGS